MTNAFTARPEVPRSAAASIRRGRLALLAQEILTAATRFRTGRQVPKDPDTLRANVKRLVLAADDEGRRAGYSAVDVKYTMYAVVAYVDETVLNSGQPAFQAWATRPLQEEIFGKQVAGEAFFQYLNQLMSRDDSEDLADVLEVYLLCLLLGFRGRYANAAHETLDAIVSRVGDRIGRIRGPVAWPPMEWAPNAPAAPRAQDPWVSRLAWTAAVLFGAWVVLLFAFLIVLRAGVPGPTTHAAAPTNATNLASADG
jgi:type VI secretion system protein ImpK